MKKHYYYTGAKITYFPEGNVSSKAETIEVFNPYELIQNENRDDASFFMAAPFILELEIRKKFDELNPLAHTLNVELFQISRLN